MDRRTLHIADLLPQALEDLKILATQAPSRPDDRPPLASPTRATRPAQDKKAAGEAEW